jgi:hypothetical protein
MIVEISTGFDILKSCRGGKLKIFSRAKYHNVGVEKIIFIVVGTV